MKSKKMVLIILMILILMILMLLMQINEDDALKRCKQLHTADYCKQVVKDLKK